MPKTSPTFSAELATAFFSSDENFPVDLDDAWRWLGYSRKDAALRKLTSHFEENTDYIKGSVAYDLHRSVEHEQPVGFTHSSATIPDKYYLTVECFKHLAMLAETDQGREVRKYFIECERTLKQKYAEASITPDDNEPVTPTSTNTQIGTTPEQAYQIVLEQMLRCVANPSALSHYSNALDVLQKSIRNNTPQTTYSPPPPETYSTTTSSTHKPPTRSPKDELQILDKVIENLRRQSMNCGTTLRKSDVLRNMTFQARKKDPSSVALIEQIFQHVIAELQNAGTLSIKASGTSWTKLVSNAAIQNEIQIVYNKLTTEEIKGDEHE
jgi:phage anti-repressor protein